MTDLWTRENAMNATTYLQSSLLKEGIRVKTVYWFKTIGAAMILYDSSTEGENCTQWLGRDEARMLLSLEAQRERMGKIEKVRRPKPDVPHVEEIRKWLAEQAAKRMDEWAKELFRRAAKEYEKMTKEEE